MEAVLWSVDDKVFAPQLDDEHEKLFADAESIRHFLVHGRYSEEPHFVLRRLTLAFLQHLANEERLMRASRYPGLNWHERQHQAGRSKLARLTEAGHGPDPTAVGAALQDVVAWLKDHIAIADRMFAAHLRNDRRIRLVS